MRPLRLVMTAFGPYAGTQVIDFTELGERSIFLIHGPTGAGKTTLLDAMCFALYGDTSGAERDARQMRSHHADPTTMTEVTFDFALGNEIYRVRRSPEQERPKQRGEGTTTQPASATLWRRTGLLDPVAEGTVLASKVGKVNEEIERLLGFKSSEFRQVVILPQGQFRKLLTADSKERQEILETLFHTELYRRIEEALRQAAGAVRKEVERAREERAWLLREAAAGSRAELEERLRLHEQELVRVSEELTRTALAVEKAQTELNAGQQAKEKLEEKGRAGAILAELEAMAPEIDARRQQLRRAQQAASLVDAENSVKVRQKEVEEAARILAEKEHELQQVMVRVQAAREQLVSESGKEEEREKARREVARLDDLTGKVQALAAARHQVSAAEQRLQEARRRQEETAAALAAVQNEVEKRTRAYVAVLERQAETGRLEGRYRELEQTGIRRKRLEEARQELAALRQAYDAVQEENRAVEQEYAGAREEAARLQETWARGQAAVLAATLVRGVPCPVCGSLEHPAPARSEAGLPAEVEVKAAQKRVEEAERLREEVRKRLGELVARKTALENRVQDLETELGENAGVDLAALREAAREAKRLWIQAGQAAQEAKSLADEVQMLREKEKRARQDLEERDRVLRQAETAYEGMQAVLRERESEVPEEFRDQEVLAKARQGAAEKLTGMVAALEEARKAAEAAARELARAEAAASEARQALLKKRERAREEEADFYARLETTGFKDLPDYHAAKMPPAAIQALEVQLREFGESLFAARDRWRRAVEAAEGLVMPDLNQLSRVLQEARHNWQQAQTRHFELRAQLQTEGEWLQKLQANESLLQELETRYSVLGRLAEVASGKNRFGLNFQRFVLGALLDDVTTAATERLKLMSRGRYHLRRTLERTHARAAGGLELEVYDTYTGLERGVATLSGGGKLPGFPVPGAWPRRRSGIVCRRGSPGHHFR